MTILFMCFVLISETFALDLEDLSFGQKFEFQFPSVWVTDTSVDDCIHECQARASCSHVNYFRTAHLCEIDVSPPTLDVISVTSPGVVSWKKPSDIQGPVQCGAQECGPGLTCDADTSTCLLRECSYVDIPARKYVRLGNMNALGASMVVTCRDGFLEASLKVTCRDDGRWGPLPECVPATCKLAIESGALTRPGRLKHFDTGTGSIVDLFCDFRSDAATGYTYIAVASLQNASTLENHFTHSDHAFVRHLTVTDQQEHETRVTLLTEFQPQYNLRFLLNAHTGFIGIGSSYQQYSPYIYLGFMPASYPMNHTTQGYMANGQRVTYLNCDPNPSNRMIVFANTQANSWTPRDRTQYFTMNQGIFDHAAPVDSDRAMGHDFYFQVYYMGFGGCGADSFSYQTEAYGIAFGLPFDIVPNP